MQDNMLTPTILIVVGVGLLVILIWLIARRARKSKSKSSTLEDHGRFLVLDYKDGRHIVVLKKAMVDSLESSAGSFNTAAATSAGILYFMRSGKPVSKSDASAAGNEVARMADVNQFKRLSQPFRGHVQVPEGWGDVPVVVVSWETGRKVSCDSSAARPGLRKEIR